MRVCPACQGLYRVLFGGREGENRGLVGDPGGREEAKA